MLTIQSMSEAGGDSTFLVDNVFFGLAGSTECNPDTLGDLDGNGSVDFTDFLVLSENFGNTLESADHTQGDIDCSGMVDFADFLVLADNFGTDVAGAESVPEPATFGTFLWGLLGLLSLKRRSKA